MRQQLDTEGRSVFCLFVSVVSVGEVVGSTLVERGSSVIPHHPHLNPNPRS